MIESMGIVACDAVPPIRSGRCVPEPLAMARRCYDHVAGRVGVAIADALLHRDYILFADGGGEVTPDGYAFFAGLGLDLGRFGATRRVFCRPCLDWTERRHHLAGAVGAALCQHCLERGWLQATRDSRALSITLAGRSALSSHFGIDVDRLALQSRSQAA
jgi:hypothetical protein